MGFKHLEIPSRWEHYWTKYPEGYTILEALFNWVNQVNKMTDNLNSTNLRLDEFIEQFDDNLKEVVASLLKEMKENGELNQLINDVFFNIQTFAVNVKDYGAKGDGSDATDAIRNAVNSGHHTIFIPAGDYLISSTITVPSGVRIFGSLRGHYEQELSKSTTLIRKSNITILALNGLDIEEDQTETSMCMDVQIENITLKTDTTTFASSPAMETYRATYFVLDKVVFRGNGKALHLGAYTFDSRVINCDFVGSKSTSYAVVTTEATVANDYNDAVFQGINQIVFDSCRWEGFINTALELNDYSREMNLIGCKFEGRLQGTNGLIKFSTNSDIFIYGARITLLSNSTCSKIIEANNVNMLKADITFYNQTSTPNPLIVANGCEDIDIYFKANMNGATVTTDYYVDNADSKGIEVRGNLNGSYYREYARLYSTLRLEPMQQIKFKKDKVTPINGVISKTYDIYVEEYSSYLFVLTFQGGPGLNTGGEGALISNSYIGVYSSAGQYHEGEWNEMKTTIIDKQERSWSATVTNLDFGFTKVNSPNKQLFVSANVNFPDEISMTLNIIRLG